MKEETVAPLPCSNLVKTASQTDRQRDRQRDRQIPIGHAQCLRGPNNSCPHNTDILYSQGFIEVNTETNIYMDTPPYNTAYILKK